MSCRTDQRLSAYVDGELSAEQSTRVAEHLRQCADCAVVVQQIEQIKQTAAQLESHEPPADLFQRSLDAMDRAPERGWQWLLLAVGSATAAASLAGVLLLVNARSDTPEVSQGSASARPVSSAPDAQAAPRSTQTLARRPADPVPDAAVKQVTPGSTVQDAPKLADTTRVPAKAAKRRARGYRGVEKRYRRTVAELRAFADEQSRQWSPQERHQYRRACQVFDRAISDSRAAAALTTSDARAQDVLLDTYRQQIRYLQQSILKGALPDPSSGRPSLPALPAAHRP